MKKLLTALIILCLSANYCLAYYPATVFKFANCKIKMRQIEILEDEFLKYLEDHQAILSAQNKKYKIDQFCKLSFELNQDGTVDFASTKVIESKKKKNLDFNLQALDFLRSQKLKLEKKKDKKPIEVVVKYLAF